MKDAFWKFSLDDFFGYLFPGSVALSGIILLYFDFDINNIKQNYSSGFYVIIFIVLSYITGHIIEAFSEYIEHWVTKKYVPDKGQKSNSNANEDELKKHGLLEKKRINALKKFKCFIDFNDKEEEDCDLRMRKFYGSSEMENCIDSVFWEIIYRKLPKGESEKTEKTLSDNKLPKGKSENTQKNMQELIKDEGIYRKFRFQIVRSILIQNCPDIYKNIDRRRINRLFRRHLIFPSIIWIFVLGVLFFKVKPSSIQLYGCQEVVIISTLIFLAVSSYFALLLGFIRAKELEIRDVYTGFLAAKYSGVFDIEDQKKENRNE